MNVQAKELVIILIGIVASLLLSLLFPNYEEFSMENIFILLIVALISAWAATNSSSKSASIVPKESFFF